MTDNPKLERLANVDTLPPVDFADGTVAEVADLVLRLHQRTARERGAILSSRMLESYMDRSETERLGMRFAVLHVIEALLLLDLVELRRP